MQKGFTLVELSVVLIIMMLSIVGVLNLSVLVEKKQVNVKCFDGGKAYYDEKHDYYDVVTHKNSIIISKDGKRVARLFGNCIVKLITVNEMDLK